MSKVKFGGVQPNPKESKVWLHPHDGLKTYNLKKQEWTGGGSSNDAPTDEPESLYEFVDLGLPSGTMWATTNVGATKPEEYGLYFAWGETEGYTAEDVAAGKKVFSWNDYKLANGERYTLTKYNNDDGYGAVDNLSVLELNDDASYVSDNISRIPTLEEMQELIDNTTQEWVALNGVNGIKLVSKNNSNYIFMPAGNYYSNGNYNSSETGFYMTASLDNTEPNYIHSLAARESGCNIGTSIMRIYGMPIRPVQNK